MAGKKDRTVLELRAGSLAEADLAVRRVTGRERLSETYAFDVDFFPVNGEALDLAQLTGAEALLTLRRPEGSERRVHGILWAVEMAGVAAGKPGYRARLVPQLERLRHVRRSRIFQTTSVPDIVKKVLDEGKVKYKLSLSGSYPDRVYCVQYRESDLAFVQRLLEDEGIFFYFEHGTDEEVMVLADAGTGCVELPEGASVPFRVEALVGDSAEDEHLYRLEQAHRVRAGKVELKDFDFERPELLVTGSSKAGGDKLGLEHYEYPGGFVDPSAGTQLSKVRLEELRFGADTFGGEGTCLRFAPGATFEVTDHPSDSFNKKLLLVRVEHQAEQQEGAGDVEAIRHGYRNRFLALDAGVPYRPQRRTRPPVACAETATVVGASGEEIFPDQHGSVKVQFHWDREGKKDDKSSCWIRVAQAWAGPAWGASFVPRIGQEVLVRFLDGDPDQPLVVGAVYNGQHPPPIALPDEKTKSTLRSDSSPGGGGSNELRFEDQKDAEEVYLHAQKDENIVVEKDKLQSVYANESLEVSKDRSRKVGRNQSLRVGKDDGTQVGGNQSLSVLGNRETRTTASHGEEVAGQQAITVARASTVEVGAAGADTVGAAAVLSVGGAYAVTVGGVLNVAVVGARLEEVGGLRAVAVGAASELRVAKDASARAGGEEKVSVEGAMNASTAKDQEEKINGKAAFQAKEPAALLARSFQLEAQQKLSVAVGGKVLLEAKSSGDVSFRGDTFTVDGSEVTFKGSQVAKSAGGSAAGAPAGKGAAEEKKKGTGKAKWSKSDAEPLHTDASGAVPAACDVTPDVQVENVPDGKKAVITVCHCASGAMVPGGKIECEVKGGKLVDAKTKKPPVFHFGTEQLPWDPYDSPFFFFKAVVADGGLKVETPSDTAKALRVKYFHVCLGDHWADFHPPHLTTGAEASEIQGILGSVPYSKAEARMMSMPNPTFAVWSRHMAGTYCYHHGSHGTCQDRKTLGFIDVDPPPKGVGDPPQCPVGNWRSVVILAKAAPYQYAVLGDNEVRDKKKFPSVPRYLVYLDCCLAGWEPSLGRAFVSRGTQYVIAFRRTIPDGDARAMARKFHKKWAQTHKLNPDKIRDLFFEVATPYYQSMRPVLISWRYEAILAPGAGALERAFAAIGNVIVGIVNAIGSLFK